MKITKRTVIIAVAVVAAIALVLLVFAACSPKKQDPYRNYNSSWGSHYSNGRYDPNYDYGLGYRIEKGRKIYIVPSVPPPRLGKNTTTAPKPTVPVAPPKSTAPNQPTPKAPPKATTQAPKPAPKPAPKSR